MRLNRSSFLSAWLFAIASLSSQPARAQAIAPATQETRVNEGRALLAQGNTARAATLAHTLLTQYPKSPAVLEFAVDVEIASGGVPAGLTIYASWVTANMLEDPRALHQIARAALREAASGGGLSVATKVLTLQALAEDGDADAAAVLASEALRQETGAALLAPTGNEQAITALITELQNPMGNRRRAIVALGGSHSRRAVNPLIAMLNDPNPDIRGACAEALGKLGAPEAINPLKALMNDPVFPVHFQAAAALFALRDPSGLTFLRQLETSEEPGMRLAAAQATSSQPDGAWLVLVRELANNKDAEIRRQAATLLAPHDADAARTALKPLLDDPNVAERDTATDSYLQYAETDLAALRGYLAPGKPVERRVRAAIRVLELTR